MANDKVFTIKDFKITKIFLGASGVRGDEKIPWQIINFYIDYAKAEDKRMSKFVNPTETQAHPYVGAKIASMSFTKKESGKYTNYNVEEIEYAEGYDPKDGAEAKKIRDGAADGAGFNEPGNVPDEAPPVIKPEDLEKELAPIKSSSTEVLCACIASATEMVKTLMTTHPEGNKITWPAARVMIAEGAVTIFEETIKKLEVINR